MVRCADREVYVWYRHGMSGSKTAQQLDRRLKTLATDRNWNTVTRLLAMASEDGSPGARSAAYQEDAP